MLYGSETWCLRKNELAILRRAEFKIYGESRVKLVDKTNTEKLMYMLGLKKAADKLARANGVRWYGHVLRRPEEDVLMKAIVHKVNGKRKQGRPRIKWKKQVEESMRRIGFRAVLFKLFSSATPFQKIKFCVTPISGGYLKLGARGKNSQKLVFFKNKRGF